MGISTCSGGASLTAPGSVNLAWDAVSSANLSGYRVYYGTAPGTYLQPLGRGLDAGNITGYAITGLTIGTRTYLAITAYDAANVESAYSNEVCKVVQ